MGKVYNNQIKAGSGFAISGPYPLDDRLVVKTYEDLASLADSNYAYEGMEIYVVSDNKSYKLINGTWKVVLVSEGKDVGKLIIKRKDVADQTFIATQSTDFELIVPTAFSELTNDCEIQKEDITKIFSELFGTDFKDETESTPELVDSE
jgi:hypothetical protein